MDDIERLQKRIAERDGQIRKLKDANEKDKKELQRKQGGDKGFWSW